MLPIIKTIKVNESSFRKLDDPFENGVSKKYIFYVKIDNVPEGIPMSTNPRDQKLTSDVATKITDSLESNDGKFHLKNRGIVISADTVHYNNQTHEVTLKFTDELCHGDIDGGHTYKIVCEHKGQGLDQYVQFEVMTGVEDIIEALAEARNTSVQVDAKSLAELAQKFEPIKEALEGMPFYKRIAFKQNQLERDEDGKNLKMIDAREIVSILSMFNIDRYKSDNHPTQAYSSKAKMLEYYLDDPDYFKKFVNIAPDIFDLYDAIETEFADAYNNTGGKYGRKKYSGYKDNKVIGKSKFGEKDLHYKIPDGLMYPTVAAFRSVVRLNENTDLLEWENGINPIALWDKCKDQLASKIMGIASLISDNPNAVGKAADIWDLAYMTVEREK